MLPEGRRVRIPEATELPPPHHCRDCAPDRTSSLPGLEFNFSHNIMSRTRQNDTRWTIQTFNACCVLRIKRTEETAALTYLSRSPHRHYLRRFPLLLVCWRFSEFLWTKHTDYEHNFPCKWRRNSEFNLWHCLVEVLKISYAPLRRIPVRDIPGSNLVTEVFLSGDFHYSFPTGKLQDNTSHFQSPILST